MPEEPQDQVNELNSNQNDYNHDQPMIEPDFNSTEDQSSDAEVDDNNQVSEIDNISANQEAGNSIDDNLSNEPMTPNLENTEEAIENPSNLNQQSWAEEQSPVDALLAAQTAIPPAVEPIEPQATDVIEKKKPRFSKKLIGLVVAGAIVLISGVSAFAAYSWYQAPQKVLTDSLFNAIKSKSVIYTGDINYSGNGYDLKLSVSGKNTKSIGAVDIDASIKVSGKDYKVLASGMIVDSGDLYFKVGGLEALAGELKSAIGEYGDYYSDPIDKLVTKINDKWIKVSNTDLAGLNKDYSDAQKCISSTIDKYMNDNKAIDEVLNLYDKNKFIIIDKELGQKDGSYGYEINGDKVALLQFVDGLKDTAIYKSLKDCDDNFDVTPKDFGLEDASIDTSTGAVEVWVDGWTHQITNISANGKDSSDSSELSLSINPVFDKDVSVEAPSDFMTIDELKNFITDLLSA